MSAAKPYNWTPARIRAATPHPKPQGALARVYDLEAGRIDAGRDVTPAERALLRHIAAEADVVAETPHPDLRVYLPVIWVLVPLQRRHLDMLAEFETDEREADTDREPDVDREPSLGAANVGHNYDQTNWGTPSSMWDADCELDDSDREPDQDDWNHVEARAPEIVPARQVGRRPRPCPPVLEAE